MNRCKKIRFPKFLSKAKVKHQLELVYLLSIFFPILLLGAFLMKNSSELLTSYYQDMLEADNLRVKNVISETTAQVTDISEKLAFAEAVVQLLKQEKSWAEGKVASINSYIYTNSQIADISIITDNPNAEGYTHFFVAGEEVKMTEWYRRAKQEPGIF